MTERTVTHATFVIDRTFDAPPARLFEAFADREAKARWFSPAQEFDFRVGGREFNSAGPPEGPSFTFEARYQDIVPAERIVFTYDMLMGGERISVSLVTIEVKPAGAGTRLTYTEQGAYLDAFDTPAIREEGSRGLLEMLAAEVSREAVAA